MKTDTAHRAWDDHWRSPTGRARWLEPDPRVAGTATALAERGAKTALDIGAGIGRHSRMLAALGLEVTAVDMSEAGLAEIERMAEQDGLEIATKLTPMTELPFADASFDFVLAFNVLYHGDGAVVRRAHAEITRVVKPGGVYQGTMLSKRNVYFGRGTEIAENTFVSDGGDDKMHPHFFCDAAELVALLPGFELLSLEDAEQKAGEWHWHLVAERRGG